MVISKVFEEAGRKEEILELLSSIAYGLSSTEYPVEPYIENNAWKNYVSGKYIKIQAESLKKSIEDGEDFEFSEKNSEKFKELGIFMSSMVNTEMHNYAVYKSHRMTNIEYDDIMENIRVMLILDNFLMNINFDEVLFSIPDGWKKVSQ